MEDAGKEQSGSGGGVAVRVEPVTPWLQKVAVEARLREHGVHFQSLVKMDKRDHCIVSFASQEALDANRDKLLAATSIAHKNKPLKLKDAKYLPPRAPKPKRNRDPEASDTSDRKRPKKELPGVRDVAELPDVRDVVAELWRMPYEEQLLLKKKRGLEALETVRKEMQLKDPICALDSVIASPVKDGYRNKILFSFGKDKEGQPSLGFQIGSFGSSSNSVVIGSSEGCVSIPVVAVKLGVVGMEIVQKTELPVYVPTSQGATGFWRRLLIRLSFEFKTILVEIQVNPKGFSTEEVSFAKKTVVDCFSVFHLDDWKMSTILFQEYEGVSNSPPSDLPSETLFGPGYLFDSLMGLKFRVQPQSFFQVNNGIANLLFSKAGEWLDLNEQSVLLDVCCGTGTIGICLAKSVKEVIGFELIEAAVQDAKDNALLNDLKNCRFIVGKCEDTLKKELQTVLQNDPQASISAVVDPPRAGLHKSVLLELRQCDQLKKLVYISCNPTSLERDLQVLLRPENGRRPGRPFTAVKAAVADMFPHTKHCEMIVLLNR